MGDVMEKSISVYDPTVGDLVLKVDEDGIIRRFRVTMSLQSKRDVTSFSGKGFIGVPGTDRLNQVMSLTILTPNSIFVDNKAVTNPYIERNKQGLAIGVTVKKVAIGYSMTGQLVAIDHTVSYNAHTLLLQSLSKVVGNGSAVCFLGTEDDEPASGKDHKARWIFIPIVEPMGYWIDLTRPAIQNVMKAHVNILTTLERRAQSICTRNVIAHHPACGGAYAEPDGAGGWKKTVYGIRKEADPVGLEKKVQAIQAGEEIGNVFEDAEVITTEDSSEPTLEDVIDATTDIEDDLAITEVTE